VAEWGGLLSRCRRKPTQGSNPCLSALFLARQIMRYELQRIEIWSVIKIIFIISLFLGSLISIFYAGLFFIMSAFGNALAPAEFASFVPMGGAMAIGIIVFGTITIAITYTIAAVVFIGIYNLLARWVGGFKVHFKLVEKEQPALKELPEEETEL
jgi:hypothetical protein